MILEGKLITGQGIEEAAGSLGLLTGTPSPLRQAFARRLTDGGQTVGLVALREGQACTRRYELTLWAAPGASIPAVVSELLAAFPACRGDLWLPCSDELLPLALAANGVTLGPVWASTAVLLR